MASEGESTANESVDKASCGLIGDASKLGLRQICPALSQWSSQHVLLGTGAEWYRIYSKTSESPTFFFSTCFFFIHDLAYF